MGQTLKYMRDFTNIFIETPRLLLIPISSQYREDIFREFTKDITKFMFPQPNKDIAEVDKFIQESQKEMKKGTNMQMVLLDKETKEFLGCPGLHHIDRKDPEMGIWIKKSAQGNKYGQEAMLALKQWADEHLDYEYIIYPVAIKNIASRKIPELLGGEVVREYIGENQLGEKMEEVEYRIYPSNKN